VAELANAGSSRNITKMEVMVAVFQTSCSGLVKIWSRLFAQCRRLTTKQLCRCTESRDVNESRVEGWGDGGVLYAAVIGK